MAPDQEIMAFAESDDYVVFTNDLDFGILLARSNAAKPSVIRATRQTGMGHRNWSYKLTGSDLNATSIPYLWGIDGGLAHLYTSGTVRNGDSWDANRGSITNANLPSTSETGHVLKLHSFLWPSRV
jgi:hypothetical protein